MSDLIKWGLLAGGVYLLWNTLSSATTAAASTATPGTTPVTPTGTPVTTVIKPTPVTPVSPSVPPAIAASCALAQQVLAAAGGINAKLNADTWNYYWSQASGVPQTADLFPVGNRDALLSFDQYLVARTAAGIGVSGDCSFPTRDQPGPAGLASYIAMGRNYMRRGTPMRAR